MSNCVTVTNAMTNRNKSDFTNGREDKKGYTWNPRMANVG